MSVQLVLYPQNYQGYSFTTNAHQPEYIADNQNFITVGTGASNVVLTAGQTPTTAVASSAPFGNWKKYNFTGETTPTIVSNRLHLTGQNGNTKYTGVYQKLTNLIVGQVYQFRININTSLSANSALTVGFINMPNMLGGAMQFVDCSGTGLAPSLTFIAQNVEETLCLNLTSSTNDVLQINWVSLRPLSNDANNLNPQDGQVIVDLYEEEEIPLTLSVDDFKNVAEKVQSYSKDFNLPATKRNNKIFDNIFEITRADNGLVFNPYKQTAAILKENGFTIFQGFLRLIEIKTQEGEISYNVNLYSEAIALADVLESKTFSDLDFSELDHDYNRTNIQNSWYGILPVAALPISSFANNTGVAGATTTNVLKYPFVDWTGQINLVASTTEIANGATIMRPTINRLEDVYRPWIRLKYLINKIFSDAGFTWTSTFFDTANFDRLFMDFNWGADATPGDYTSYGEALSDLTSTNYAPNGSYGTVLFPDPGASTLGSTSGYNYSTSIFTVPNNNTTYIIDYDIIVHFSGAANVVIEWYTSTGTVYDQTTLSYTSGFIVTRNYTGQLIVNLNATETLQCRFKANQTNTVKQSQISGHTNTLTVQVSTPLITSGSLLNTLRGELGQWDFFKGIMTMFNLVALQDTTNPTNLIIEPYDDVFINNTNAVTYDWTHKIDESQIQLKPLDLKRDVIFQYEEDDDYPFSVYKNATNQHLYGSFEYTASQYTLLTGEEKIEATPFASTIMKPVFDIYPDLIAPSIYGANDDETEFTGIDNKPRILYDVSGASPYSLAGTTYFTPAQNGVVGTNATGYSLFSHTTAIPSTATDTDYNFGVCQFINGIGVAPIDNLFNTYYSNYYDELYHPDTRTLTIKVLLNPSDIANFEFYNKVQIKNRIYRVNKINYKPKDLSTVEFILIS